MLTKSPAASDSAAVNIGKNAEPVERIILPVIIASPANGKPEPAPAEIVISAVVPLTTAFTESPIKSSVSTFPKDAPPSFLIAKSVV
jgi:hypothetical protein